VGATHRPDGIDFSVPKKLAQVPHTFPNTNAWPATGLNITTIGRR
jgi:hypothetical protein